MTSGKEAFGQGAPYRQQNADAPPPYDPASGSSQADAGFWPDEKKSREAGGKAGGYLPPPGPPPGPPGPPSGPGPSQYAGGSYQPPHPAGISATNFVNVENPNNSIRGVWYVDPSISIHPSLLGPVPPGSVRQNVRVYSKNGSVNAEVMLLGGGRERALMDIGSKNGSVTVKVAHRAGHPFYLNAYSNNGGVTVYLPDNFVGSIRHNTHNGKATFSPALQPRHTSFQLDHKGSGHSFIGDLAGSGYAARPGEWFGDEIITESKNGSIKFILASEAESGSSSGGGLGGFLKKFT